LAFEYRPFVKLSFSSRFTLASGLPFSYLLGAYQRWSAHVIHTPSDYPAHDAEEQLFYLTAVQSERDAFRFPWYHRLDVSAEYSFNIDKVVMNPYVQIINVYNQANVLYYDAFGEAHGSVPFLPLVGVKLIF
jgi:hypothetical protein